MKQLSVADPHGVIKGTHSVTECFDTFKLQAYPGRWISNGPWALPFRGFPQALVCFNHNQQNLLPFRAISQRLHFAVLLHREIRVLPVVCYMYVLCEKCILIFLTAASLSVKIRFIWKTITFKLSTVYQNINRKHNV